MKSGYTPASSLISAAPLMLEALKEAVAAYGKPGGPWNVPTDPGGWISRARNAITHAESMGAYDKEHPEPARPVEDAFFLTWGSLPDDRIEQLNKDDCYRMFAAGWVSAISTAAIAVEQHDKPGHEWVGGSLWDRINREAAGRIRSLNPERKK